ncbi:MAG: hypothetical protein RL023_523 [Candidatus Parcubacteria bacterium]|jgi:hypothetical protein
MKKILTIALLALILLGLGWCKFCHNAPMSTSETILKIKKSYPSSEWVIFNEEGPMTKDFKKNGTYFNVWDGIHLVATFDYKIAYGYKLPVKVSQKITMDEFLDQLQVLYIEDSNQKIIVVQSGVYLNDQEEADYQSKIINEAKIELKTKFSTAENLARIKAMAIKEFERIQNGGTP